jgi:uncharacterized protein DUF4242
LPGARLDVIEHAWSIYEWSKKGFVLKSKIMFMKKFVIERIIPGAANFSKEELQLISHIFCEAANKVETSYTWVQSFITDDKIYCIHIAENKENNSRAFENFPVPNQYDQ